MNLLTFFIAGETAMFFCRAGRKSFVGKILFTESKGRKNIF